MLGDEEGERVWGRDVFGDRALIQRGDRWRECRALHAARFPLLSSADLDAYADAGILRVCEHKPWQTYSRYPCECGRSLWPPRGRGRGEPLTSPRRVEALVRAQVALEMRQERDATWGEIAAALGFTCRASAWKAVRRALDRIGEKGRPMPHRAGPAMRGLARDMKRIDRLERRALDEHVF